MTVTIDPLAQDERRNFRFLGTATLGDGTKKVLGIHQDEDIARQIAENRATKAERELAAIEVHDPGTLNMTVSDGNRMLKDPAGVIVEVPHHVVEALLAVGYVPADAPDPHPALGLSSASVQDASTPVIPAPGLAGDQRHVLDDDQPRRRGRPPKQQPVE